MSNNSRIAYRNNGSNPAPTETRPIKRLTKSNLPMDMWLQMIGDTKLYPPAQVKGGSYSLTPHTVSFDPYLSFSDLLVYMYLSHQAGLEKSAVVHKVNARQVGKVIGVHRNKVMDSLKILIARKHLKKRLDLGLESYELLSEIYDKWRS